MRVEQVDDLTGTDAPYLWAIVDDDGGVIDRFTSEADATAALPHYEAGRLHL